MAIKETIDESLFISRFEDYDRVGENKNFTYKGLRALFSFLDDMSEYDDIELDVVSLCCDYTEYKNINDYIREYRGENPEKANLEEIQEEINEKNPIMLGDTLDDGFILSVE